MKYEQAEKIAAEYLSGKRLEHSYGTVEVAYQMGQQLNYPDLEKLKVAAILHDIGKPLELSEMQQWIKKADLKSDFIASNRALLHGSAAVAILQQRYNCHDAEILNSIRYHTTGDKNLGIFEQIIYASDFLDFNRSFPKQEMARQEMSMDFYKGLFYIIKVTIKSLASMERVIDYHSVEFYNHLHKIITQEDRLLLPILLCDKKGSLNGKKRNF